jgi:hypothetical protein
MATKKAEKEVTDKRLSIEFKPDSGMEQLITHAIDKGVDVATMEKLLAMRRELKAEWAREQFHAALSDFQAECPIIEKDSIVLNKDGKTERYRFASLDSIIRQVKDLLLKHGFNHRTNAGVEGIHVRATCVATHKYGHSENSSFEVPIDKDAFMNEPQKFASALTFSKRYAFCNAFGIQTGDKDDDAKAARSVNEEAQAEGRAPAGKKHTRMRDYENEPQPAKADTSEIKQLTDFMAEHNIPDGFVLAMLKEKKLVPANLTILNNAPPGIVRRVLASRERLLKAFEASSASPKEAVKPSKADDNRSPFDSGTPRRTSLGEEDEDQRRPRMKVREPVQTDLSPDDVLDQDGFRDWREVVIHFGKKSKGTALGKLTANSLVWWITEWHPTQYKGKWNSKDLILDAALCLAHQEMADTEGRNN